MASMRAQVVGLLTSTVAVAAGVACYAGFSRARQTERRAIDAAERLGVFVRYDYECDSDAVSDPPDPPPTPPGPAWLRSLLGDDAFARPVLYMDQYRTQGCSIYPVFRD